MLSTIKLLFKAELLYSPKPGDIDPPVLTKAINQLLQRRPKKESSMRSAYFLAFTAICLLLLAASCKQTPTGAPTQYVVRRVTTSGVCQVWDSQSSTIGDQIAGPFNTKVEATAKMCELRTADPADPAKCFQVNPANACDTHQAAAGFELPDQVVKYLDTLPLETVNIDNAILPNEKKLGEYRDELLRRGRAADGTTLIFTTDTPADQLSQLFVKFLTTAKDLVTDANHTFPKGADDNEPAQTGLGYNYGSRDYSARKKMNSATCELKVFALDCSGMLYSIFNKAGCKDMNIVAAEQSKVENLNKAIDGVITGVEARSKGKLAGSDMITGDIVYWDKLDGNAASHIGIVLKDGATLYVYQSNGSASECEGNLTDRRGPRTFKLDDVYWFSSKANWTVLRYEVK